jgi:hypothetical protein
VTAERKRFRNLDELPLRHAQVLDRSIGVDRNLQSALIPGA